MQEHLDLVAKRFEQDRHAGSLGIVLDEVTDTTIRMHMLVGENALNWFGRVHGAAIYALADAAFSVLANNANNLSVALDCSISYHASPDVGTTLVVEGEALAVTNRTGSYLFRVWMEREGERVAVATMKSVSYRTGKPIDPASPAGGS